MRISNRGSHGMRLKRWNFFYKKQQRMFCLGPDIGDIIGLELKGDNALIAADIERSSLVLCGNAFSDSNATKEALAVLSESVIFSRRGLPLSARLLVFGDYMLLLCALEDTIKGCGDLLVPRDVGVIRSSEGVGPLFQTGSSGSSNLFKLPAAAVLATFDSDFAYNYLGRWGKLYSFLLSCKAHET